MSRIPIAPAALAALLGVSLAIVTTAAENQQNQRPQFRLGITLTQIDVTVLDETGRPSRGLTREDFTLTEDGEPQEILGFAEVDIPDVSDGPAWIREVAPDVREPGDDRVLLLLLDDATAADDLWTRPRLETVKKIAAAVIDEMGPTDVAAVLCTFDKKCAQDFTTDRALLKAAVARFQPKMFPVVGGYDWFRQSAGTAGSVVQFLAEHQGRKALIYVTATMPIRPSEWPPSGANPANVVSASRAVTQQQVIRTFEHAMRAKVSVYGIDINGLISLGGPDILPTRRTVARGGGPSPTPAPTGFSAPSRSLAAETGGFVVRRPDQFTDGVAQIFRETGSYYLLGYEQPKKKDTGYYMLGGFRRIEVQVNRTGYIVRNRAGYIAPKPTPTPKTPPPAGDAALAGILPKADLPLRVAVAPFAMPGQPEAVLAVVLGVREPTAAERALDRLAVQFRAFTQRGDARGLQRLSVDATIPSGQNADVVFDVLAQMRLKPGLYALRFAAESQRLSKAGSVYADVEVPDFERAPLSLSGVLLTVAPQPPVAAGDALKPLVPVVPTTMREFSVRQSVRAFLRAYQGGRSPVVPVVLSFRILSAANDEVLLETMTLDAGRFGTTRSSDVFYEMPIGRLGGGLHLLRIEAKAGSTNVKRDVQFTVK